MNNIGGVIILDELAAQFNFTGVKNKQKFQSFKNIRTGIAGTNTYLFLVGLSDVHILCIVCISIGALRAHSKDVLTETSVAAIIGHWLTNVGERTKKKNKRYAAVYNKL